MQQTYLLCMYGKFAKKMATSSGSMDWIHEEFCIIWLFDSKTSQRYYQIVVWSGDANIVLVKMR